MAFVLATLVAVLLAVLARLLRDYMYFRKLELAIPGPPSLPLLGNALHLIGAKPENTTQTMLRLIGRRTELTRITLFFNSMLAVVSDPVDIAELVRRREFNDKCVWQYSLMQCMARNGLVQINGALHRQHRRLLEPGFNKGVLNRYTEVFAEEARGFVARVQPGEACDVNENLRMMQVSTFLRTALDDDISAYEDALVDCAKFLEVQMRSINKRAFSPWLWSDAVFMLTAMGKEVERKTKATTAVLARLMNHGRALSKSDFAHGPRTLMQIICDDDAVADIPEEDVMDEIKTFFAANVETTVSATSWILKVLSILPDVQERVHAELVEKLGDRDVTTEDIPRLEYLGCVIKECMRMFPPIPMTGRQCHQETQLAGRTIPAGSTIVLLILGVHYHPEHWPEPWRFDPDRFLPENCKNRHPYAYIPFSAGTRNCIGGRYATNNLVVFLATALRALRVLPVDDHKDLQSLYDHLWSDISSHLAGGTRVVFERRCATAA